MGRWVSGLEGKKTNNNNNFGAVVYVSHPPECFPYINLFATCSNTTDAKGNSVCRDRSKLVRCTMGQDRLHHLAVLEVEKEELSKLSQSLAKIKNRQYALMLKQ